MSLSERAAEALISVGIREFGWYDDDAPMFVDLALAAVVDGRPLAEWLDDVDRLRAIAGQADGSPPPTGDGEPMSAASVKLWADLAEAAGNVVVVGCRPHNRSWFAACDDETVDSGPGPADAVNDLASTLARSAQTAATRQRSDADRAERVADALSAAAAGTQMTEEVDRG